VHKSIEIDLELIAHYDDLLRKLEYFILRTAQQHDHNTIYRLRTVPGIGKILSLVILTRSTTSTASDDRRNSSPMPGW
jgi:hypothetical protein